MRFIWPNIDVLNMCFESCIVQRPRNLKIFKTIIIIIFIVVFAFVNLVPNMSLFKIECLLDYTHDYTETINDWFKNNSGAKSALLIIGGILSDIIVLVTLGLWTFNVKTWRLPITLVFVYVSKALTSVSPLASLP